MINPNAVIVFLPFASSLGLLALAVTDRVRRKIIKDQEGECGDCGVHARDKLEIHHKLPQSMGGDDSPGNLIGLCHNCHIRWDYEAQTNYRLPDGTPLRISRPMREK